MYTSLPFPRSVQVLFLLIPILRVHVSMPIEAGSEQGLRGRGTLSRIKREEIWGLTLVIAPLTMFTLEWVVVVLAGGRNGGTEYAFEIAQIERIVTDLGISDGGLK